MEAYAENKAVRNRVCTDDRTYADGNKQLIDLASYFLSILSVKGATVM